MSDMRSYTACRDIVSGAGGNPVRTAGRDAQDDVWSDDRGHNRRFRPHRVTRPRTLRSTARIDDTSRRSSPKGEALDIFSLDSPRVKASVTRESRLRGIKPMPHHESTQSVKPHSLTSHTDAPTRRAAA